MNTDFFEDFGKRISDVAGEIGKKTEETLEVQKIKSDIRSLNRGNARDYEEIGKAVYARYQKGEAVDGDMTALCESIEHRKLRVKELEDEIASIRGEE